MGKRSRRLDAFSCGALGVAVAAARAAAVEVRTSLPRLVQPLLVVNASAIHSMDERTPSPQAFCVGRDGRFLAVGERAATASACGASADILDAGGATILPGLMDSHAHLMDEGRRLSVADLSAAKDEATAAEAVRAFAAQHPVAPGGFILGFGWDQNHWSGGAFPSKESLDALLPSTPVYLDRVDGHAAWVNSAALRIGGVTRSTPDPEGGRIVRDSNGEPTGILVDNAKALVTSKVPPPSEAERRSWLQKCLNECAALGLTGAHDMGQDPTVIDLYQRMAEEGSLTMRVNALRLGVDEPGMGAGGKPTDPKLHEHAGLLTVRGVKFFLDGALGSWGAAMLENYTDHPELRGELRMSPEEFASAVRPWVEKGWQIATHAIGDRANRVALDTYETVLRDLNLTGSDHRFRVEHAQVLALEDIPRFGKLGVLASMQPDHAMFDMSWAPTRLGKDRLVGAYAWQKVLSGGVRALPFGSDFPTAGVVNPWWGIYAAVTRQDLSGQPPGGWLPEERVSVQQALKGYTLDAAFAAGAEHSQGSISVGKYADFVLIDRDILTVQPSSIWSTRVLGTYLGGVKVGEGTNTCDLQPATSPTGEVWLTI